MVTILLQHYCSCVTDEHLEPHHQTNALPSPSSSWDSSSFRPGNPVTRNAHQRGAFRHRDAAYAPVQTDTLHSSRYTEHWLCPTRHVPATCVGRFMSTTFQRFGRRDANAADTCGTTFSTCCPRVTYPSGTVTNDSYITARRLAAVYGMSTSEDEDGTRNHLRRIEETEQVQPVPGLYKKQAALPGSQGDKP